MPKKYAPEEVKAYYDKMTASYLSIYGDVIQAFRPTRKKDLLQYIAKSCGLKKGMRVLDAGCGVAGPAIFFADQYKVQVDGVTLSPVQVAEADKQISKAKLQKQVQVKEGDYHHLTELFVPASYDAVLFLESLGHAEKPEQVIREAYRMLKKGGFIYIKDFYRKISDDPVQQGRIDKVIGNMDLHYNYNTLDLEEVLRSLRTVGLEILFVKRFDFKDDISVRFEFERVNGIDIFEGMEEFWPAEWLEIKCVKISD